MLQEPGESVERGVVGFSEAGEDSAEKFVFLGEVDGVAGVMEGRSIDVDGVFADGGVDGAEADADTELSHIKFIMHVPEQVGKDAGVGEQSLKFVAQGDDKTRDQGMLVFLVEAGDKFGEA